MANQPSWSNRPENAFCFRAENIALSHFDIGGVLYHANYFQLLERAREALLISGGLPYPELAKNSMHLTVSEAHQQFHAPIFYGQGVEIHLWAPELGKAFAVIESQIVAIEKPKLIHSAKLKLVFVVNSEKGFRVSPMPDKLRQIFKQISNNRS